MRFNKSLILIILFAPPCVFADVYFNPDFISQGSITLGNNVDLSVFENNANSQAPGDYIVNIILNQENVGKYSVKFLKAKDGGLTPCLSKKLLTVLTFNENVINRINESPATQCASVFKVLPGSSYQFNFNQLRLNINVPESALRDNKKNILKDSWNEGLNAAIINYEYSASYNNYGFEKYRTQLLDLQSGLNLGPWRIRDISVLSKDNDGSRLNNINLFASRGINQLNSTLLIGQAYSQSDLFDSVNLVGLQLSSDNQMLPDNMQGFSPVINGTAGSNARISIYQSNQLIYDKFVQPGAFSIKDLPSMGSNGDLRVVVTEIDGSQHSFVVPYATVPSLTRKGQFNYKLAVGEINDDYLSDNHIITQGSFYYGLPLNTTLYGGAELYKYYKSLVYGVGFDLGELGAFSFDITNADSSVRTAPHMYSNDTGQSYRFIYAKGLQSTGTNFQLVGYRYSTKNYFSLNEVLAKMYTYAGNSNFIPENHFRHQRSRITGTLSQQLPSGFGAINGSASVSDYWDGKGSEDSYMMGYNNSYRNISYDLTYSYTKGPRKPYQSVYLTLFIPFTFGAHTNYISYGINHTYNNTYHNVTISGSAMNDNSLGYNIHGIYNHDGSYSHGGGFNINYATSWSNQSGGISQMDNSQQMNYDINGGILIHRHGIILGHQIDGATALVHADGAKDTAVNNSGGITLNSQGYGLISDLVPYRKNTIEISPSVMNDWAELLNTSTTVIPTDGAIVPAEFSTRVGYKGIFIFQGRKIPFGVPVDLNGVSVGIIDDQNEAYLTGLDKSGILHITWGDSSSSQCVAPYHINRKEFIKHTGILNLKVTCQ